MWIDKDLVSIGNNFLDISLLSNLIEKIDFSNPILNRPGPLSGSIVIFNKQYFSNIQGISEKSYKGVEDEIHELSYQMVEQVKEKHFKNYTILKSEVSICPPNTLQGFHVDPRVFHRISKRVHIPIKTNLDCFLEINDTRYFLDPKFLWEFNNIKPHRSGNLGNESRTHLIVDFVNNDVLNNYLLLNNLDSLFSIVDRSRKFL